ncbi:MAG: exo-alpha-sialidase [Candidatus Nomurabacteria bacterium]|nr:MAG: exo-alpha-sialidase [Candidatus Nomurabacteria bacterium]
MFRWKKLGKVFDPTQNGNDAWMQTFAQAPATLVFDSFVRVYFSCRPLPDKNGQATSYAGFVDLDRKNLFNILRISKKPVLPLGEIGSFDEFGIMPISVIRDKHRLLAYYGGWTRCVSVPFNIAIGLAESKDNGETFEKIGPGPVLSYSPDEPFLVAVPKIRKFQNRWFLWYTAGTHWRKVNGKTEAVYGIRMATSTDGVTWKKEHRKIIPNVLGENEAQASADVYFANDIYHMFFCYRHTSDFRTNKDRAYRIGYAYSQDGFHWQRDDSRVGIDISTEGWDSEMISFPHIFSLDGKTYMLYLGNNFGREGFGIAELEGSLQ